MSEYKVSRLTDRGPHLVIKTPDGNTHSVPVVFFRDVAAGRRSIDALDDRDIILQVIIADWLKALGAS